MRQFLSNFLIRHFNYKSMDVHDVFTPTTCAKYNYVNRPELEPNIIKNIHIPGKQMLVLGHSGIGKTTIIRKM